MTEAERQIAALLAQAQMDREAVPSTPSALASALTKHIPEDKPRFGRWRPDALASGETAKAGIVGKLLGALGLDASGNRAATSWTDAAKHTASNVINAPQDIGNQLLDLQDYQPVYGTGASNPEDRARAGQQAVSTFGLAGLAPLGGVAAGKVAGKPALTDAAPHRYHPETFYHGTNQAFDTFGDLAPGQKHFFARDPALASEYAIERAWERGTDGANVIPVKVRSDLPIYDQLGGIVSTDTPGTVKSAITGEALYANSKEGALPGLAMDHASRMERAKQMGWDVDKTLYHATHNDFDAFDLSAPKENTPRGSSNIPQIHTTTSREEAGNYGPKILDLYARGTYRDVSSPMAMQDTVINRLEKLKERIERDIHQNDKREASGLERNDRFQDETYHRVSQYLDGAAATHNYADRIAHARMRGELSKARRDGADGVRIQGGWGDEHGGDHYVVFDPKNLRRTDAAFDPAQSHSPNLLASNAREGAVPGLLAQAGEQKDDYDTETLTRLIRDLSRK